MSIAMSLLNNKSVSPCRHNTNRKRKGYGAVGSNPSHRRVRINGDVIRVLCPFYTKTPNEPCKANSCWITGFSEIAKMRDHLKDVHELSKELLDKLNFKGGRFRNLKSIEEKWRHAFLILFPEIPKDSIPSPFKVYNNNNNNETALSTLGDEHGPTFKEECTSKPRMDFTSLVAGLQDRLFERLSINTNVPTNIKMDLLSNLAADFEDIVAGLTGEADLGVARSWVRMAQEDRKGCLEDLNLDWSTLSAYNFTPECQPKAGATEIEPALGIGKVDGETDMDCDMLHGVPGSSVLATRPSFESAYSDVKWGASQPFMTGPMSSPNDLSYQVTDEKMVQDCRYQLPTPPATPSSCDSPLNEKAAFEPDLVDHEIHCGLSANQKNDAPTAEVPFALATDCVAQNDFDISEFIECVEDERYYHLNSFELDLCNDGGL